MPEYSRYRTYGCVHALTEDSTPTSLFQVSVSVLVSELLSVREFEVVLSVPAMTLLLMALELVVPLVSEPPDCVPAVDQVSTVVRLMQQLARQKGVAGMANQHIIIYSFTHASCCMRSCHSTAAAEGRGLLPTCWYGTQTDLVGG